LASSIHDKLERVRKPRVHIKYEVETEGAVIEKELPFVVGVLGDFSGDPTEPLKPFGERKFIQIDRDNFDDVMRRLTPGLNMRVENVIGGEGKDMAVSLKFEKLDDFEPGAIVNQVPALKALLESRNELRDLLSKADRSEDLEVLLEKIPQGKTELKKLAEELGAEGKAEGKGK
jgi:type VI secretion system protein ImpB